MTPTALTANAPAFGGGGGGFGGGFVAAASSPVAPTPAFGGGFTPSAFGSSFGASANQAPLTPDPNVPNSDAWCAAAFTSGAIPDDAPPPQYIR